MRRREIEFILEDSSGYGCFFATVEDNAVRKRAICVQFTALMVCLSVLFLLCRYDKPTVLMREGEAICLCVMSI